MMWSYDAAKRVRIFVSRICDLIALKVLSMEIIIRRVSDNIGNHNWNLLLNYHFRLQCYCAYSHCNGCRDNIGFTYGKTVNRVGGLMAGIVVPSIFSFFVCAVVDDDVYNTLNNIVLFVWTVGSMYQFYGIDRNIVSIHGCLGVTRPRLLRYIVLNDGVIRKPHSECPR
ncbi:hypothetical protein KXD40_004973 [Peronospora effusa]|nr:hypothetical protein KXD40_004973 [Peronospora effusa]